MRPAILLATILGLCCLLLCAVGGGLPLLAVAQPQPVLCTCTDVNGGAWTNDGFCGTSGQRCQAAALVSDSLACGSGTASGGCPVTGSVTVAYDACTSVVCVKERHFVTGQWGTACQNQACPQSGSTLVDDGDAAQATLNACCDIQPPCDYWFQVFFYSAPVAGCPGPGFGSEHCLYEHHFQCRP